MNIGNALKSKSILFKPLKDGINYHYFLSFYGLIIHAHI